MQQDLEEILCSPGSLFYVSPSLYPNSNLIWLHSRYTDYFSICLITSLQHLSFKLRNQSCLNSSWTPQFSRTTGTWHFSWNYMCASMKRRMPRWLKDLLIMSPQFFKAFIQRIALLISWLFIFHYCSSHKLIFDILNDQFACMPKTGGEMSRKCSWEWQRTWEDMVCETIWVIFVKDLEAVAISLLQRINSQISVASSNDIWN